MKSENTSILIVYTGGTIGMKQNPETGALAPFNFEQIEQEVPELRKFGYTLNTISFSPVIDSSDINPSFWVKLAQIISENYDKYDGFVILHGTDTMSFTASALSFMLEGLTKPVVLTGSQLPIGMLRTDGKENLISAIEIAAAYRNGQALVPEVSVFFENRLYRGNRTTKHNSEHFNAFRSNNYPPLAEAGISIKFNYPFIHYPTQEQSLFVHTMLDNSIAVLKLFPGITENVVSAVLNTQGVKGIILETYGSGNAPMQDWFLERIEEAIGNNIVVFNVTQCKAGGVDMDKYENGLRLKKIGVVSGSDITFEAAVAKLMFLLGKGLNGKTLADELTKSIAGEITLK
ncbi:asparaginase [Tenuifilum thalassicum]|uniref:asparaginase n=1 Tax=Tenuifilum thalassicum TaxID=2590900 RepID=A0A7D3XK16_9BACT|nr:type I asparaginase [Tenuifilum thalassicum]QKG79075.1 type I asparaginase [Tenuifilum thalassicum]